ncbi:RNA-binding protein 25-like [Macadamia integrifolia]|uniref:RNA-binding protein 25-like n=1 Tax=Macadamia integrifolia TaxID=60698 RepID=UPI001C4E7DA5|nr:RNA-binding protein 25-like [Macadamia integrifolia]XP_042510819.1 RNA-binding protein 25-like [Macadamia integrifolia]
MGKKVTKKKTKEIREVVGEASSGSIAEQQSQPRRKRGRPRKIIENTQVTIEAEEEKNQAEEQKEEEAAAVEESESKRMKSSDVEQLKGIRSVSSSSSVGDVKGGTGPSDESKTEEPPKSSRRKSQPRKSSS